MKIALIHADLPNETKGGVAYVVHYLGNALIQQGHEVTVFSYSPHYSECLYKVHQVNGGQRNRRFQAFSFAYHLSKEDLSGFDVLHAHGDNYLLGRFHPQVRTFHGSAREEFQSAKSIQRKVKQALLIYLEKRAAKISDVCTGVSESTSKYIPAAKLIIPNGVDVNRFVPVEKASAPTVLFVGTVGGRKRGAWLAKVFQEQVRSQIPDAVLWSVADAPLEGEGIVNWGRVSLEKLTALYGQAWVFCLPSTYEGFGVPYIEAMAAKTAVLASPNPGALEVLRDGELGVIAKDEDLGTQLRDLLQDGPRRDSLAIAGRRRAESHYAWPKVVEQYLASYRQAQQVAAKNKK